MKEKVLFRVGYDDKDELDLLYSNILHKLEHINYKESLEAYYPYNKIIIDNCIIYFKSNYSRDIDLVAYYDYYFNSKEAVPREKRIYNVDVLVSKIRGIIMEEKKEKNENMNNGTDYEKVRNELRKGINVKITPLQKYFINFEIEKVIFNYPATIVLWKDGSKTVVKCQEGDIFDAEKGLAMCFAKKALGNKGNFNDVFKEWVYMPEEINILDKIREFAYGINESLKSIDTAITTIDQSNKD